ncbi:HNH endonuclease [Weissella phage PWc]|nr:HNH endonuclease [Weissella phage PWc]
MEEKREIPYYENYVITKNGDVYNVKTYEKERKLKWYFASKEPRVTLSRNGKTQDFTVASLVYFTFISTEKLPNLCKIEHINGNLKDCSVDNLRLKGEK